MLWLEQKYRHEPSIENPSRLGTERSSNTENSGISKNSTKDTCSVRLIWPLPRLLPRDPSLNQNTDKEGLKMGDTGFYKRLGRDGNEDFRKRKNCDKVGLFLNN